MGLALLVGFALAAVWLNRKEQLPPLISEEDLRIMRDTAANGEQVGTESKLFEKPYVLKTGRPVEAARGLENRMNVMQEHLAEQVAKGVEGIQFCHFEDVDVVRHSLVQRIIRAYEGKSQQQELPLGAGLGMGDGPEQETTRRPGISAKPPSKPQ